MLQVFLKGKVGRRGVGPASVGFIVDKQVSPLSCGTCLMLWLSSCTALQDPVHELISLMTLCGVVLQLNL